MEFSDAIFTDNNTECFTDKITGLNNKTGMKYLLDNFIKQYERYEDNWVLILLTIKNEKKWDQTLKKDTIIQTVAQKLSTLCRKSDIIFYLYDYYFCILTRVFNQNNVDEFIMKIQNNLGKIFKIGNDTSLALKYGTAFMKYNDSAENMLKRAFYSMTSVK